MNSFASISEALDCLAPEQQFVPAWEDTLARAGMESALRGSRLAWRRYWLIAVVVLAAVLIPLAAIGSSRDWWFLSDGMGPNPATDVIVAKTGSWGGHDWELVTYRSDTGDICFGIIPTHSGAPVANQGAMACTRIIGVPHGPDSTPDSGVGISDLISESGPIGSGEQRYIAGPVVDNADQVEIYLTDGQVVRTPTFDAPKDLGMSIHFYATQLPPNALPLKRLVGLDKNGKIVACLTIPFPKNGVALSACE